MVERTLLGITTFFREALFPEETIKVPGLLQGLDPRIKLLTFALFLLTTSLVQKASVLAGLYLFTLFLAAASGLKLGSFIKRVWVFIPIFSGVIALPALFLVPGEPLVEIFQLWGLEVSITKQGASSALLFLLRVATSVSFAILLMLTTRWAHLLKALRVFRIPQVFVLILGMAHRYVYLLIALIEEIHLAKKSRTIKGGGLRREQRWVASRIGFLFGKSRWMAEEVYQAMVARGFEGEVKVMHTFKVRGKDLLWIGLSVLIVTLSLWIGGAHEGL